MTWLADEVTVVALVRAATTPCSQSEDPLPARFAIELRPEQDPVAIASTAEQERGLLDG